MNRDATLHRVRYPEFSAGIMAFDDRIIYTVERPWVCCAPTGRAGEPFESCIPEGRYKLARFTRSSGELAWSLENPTQGVYVREEDRRYETDRYACLIHAANYPDEVSGCIGPGFGAVQDPTGKYMVSSSRDAMAALEDYLSDVSHLVIKYV